MKLTEAAVRSCAIFANAADTTVMRLCDSAIMVKFSKKQTVYEAGDTAGGFHIIISGTVRAKGFSPDGKEVAYGDIAAGNIFGEFAALDGSARSATIVAVEDVIAASLPSSCLTWAVQNDPEVAMSVVRELVTKNRTLTERVFEFSVLAVRQRVQTELLRIARASGKHNGNSVTVNIPTHQDYAANISSHREAITRELNFLVSKGLIKKNDRSITIPDVSAYEQFLGNLTT